METRASISRVIALNEMDSSTTEGTLIFPTRFEDQDDDLEFTLHKLLTEDHEEGDNDALGEAIEKAIAQMEFPELLDSSSTDTSTPHSDSTTTTKQQHLTVENILANDTLLPMIEEGEMQPDVGNACSDEEPLAKKAKIIYETLSPESLSPFSDNERQLKNNNDDNSIKTRTAGTGTITSSHTLDAPTTGTTFRKPRQKFQAPVSQQQKVLQEIPLPPKFTNEFTMAQVSEMKKRIINTHKLILNFNFLKDGYTRSCTELKRTMVKLKQSECHRAHLLRENENLKRLVLELSEKLETKE